MFHIHPVVCVFSLWGKCLVIKMWHSIQCIIFLNPSTTLGFDVKVIASCTHELLRQCACEVQGYRWHWECSQRGGGEAGRQGGDTLPGVCWYSLTDAVTRKHLPWRMSVKMVRFLSLTSPKNTVRNRRKIFFLSHRQRTSTPHLRSQQKLKGGEMGDLKGLCVAGAFW